jgi:hypothetical protein
MTRPNVRSSDKSTVPFGPWRLVARLTPHDTIALVARAAWPSVPLPELTFAPNRPDGDDRAYGASSPARRF